MSFPPMSGPTRWFYFGLVYIFAITSYLTSNHYQVYPTHFLSMTYLDRAVPFVPWTAWIYILVYALPLYVGVVVEETNEVKMVIYAYAGLVLLDTLIFIFYPTAYPRGHFSTSQSTFSFPLDFVRAVDSPANCMPSQHVSLAFLSAFFIQRYRKLAGNVALLLAIAIAFSTLTTKQHYVWDIIAGYFLARMAYTGALKYLESTY